MQFASMVGPAVGGLLYALIAQEIFLLLIALWGLNVRHGFADAVPADRIKTG